MSKNKNGNTATTLPSSARAGADGTKDEANSSPPAPLAASDDLKRISGIGPGVERKLRKAGITSFAQIEAMSDDALKELERVLKVPGGVDWDAWKLQAREFMAQTREDQKYKKENPSPAVSGAGADDGGAGGLPVSGSADSPAADTSEQNSSPAGDQAKDGAGGGETDPSVSKPPAPANQDNSAITDPPMPEGTDDEGDGSGIASRAPEEDAGFEGDPFGDGGHVLVVKSKSGSRRRAGYGFTPEETRIPTDQLRLSQAQAIDADPELLVALEVAEPGED